MPKAGSASERAPSSSATSSVRLVVLRDEVGVGLQVLAHDGAVDDVLRRQAPGAGRDRVADLDRALRHRLALDLVAAGALDRARHACAHPEVVVGGVGDRVDLELRDVALDDLELHVGSFVRRG